MNKLCSFASIYTLLIILFNRVHSQTDEGVFIKKLRDELLKNRKYDKMSRPVKQHQTPTLVSMSITVVQFTELESQRLTTEGYIDMSWFDEHLTWNANEFGGLSEIHFGYDELWKPDITLWNSADNRVFGDNFAKTHLLVNSSGRVLWVPPATFTSTCLMDLTNYPFDEHTCYVYFGSWTQHSGQLNITTSGDSFWTAGPWYNNSEWSVTKKSSNRYDFQYPNYGFFSALSLIVGFKRNASFYKYTIKLPSIAAIILTLAVFWLPSHSSIRFTLCSISLFISLSLLLYLGTQLGFASIGVPLAVQNLSFLVIMVGTAFVITTLSYQTLCACINSNLTLPPFLANLFKGIFGQIFCIGDSILNLNKPTTMDVERLTQEQEDTQTIDAKISNSRRNDWILLFTFIDRLIFIIFLIILSVKHA